MKFKVKIQVRQNFLPTSRHRKERYRYIHPEITVNVNEVQENEFKTVIIVKKYDGTEDELRGFKGQLYTCAETPVISSFPRCISNDGYASWDDSEEFDEERSVILSDDRKESAKSVRAKAKEYLIFQNRIWKKCGEPMYVIMTFGLGHNHGGTALMLDYFYNPNISNTRYYNALHRKEAIKAAKEIAIRRGDTEFVDDIGSYCNIIVLDESYIHRRPAKEHGDGDPFMNDLESITNGTESAEEAGLLAVAYTLANLSGGNQR